MEMPETSRERVMQLKVCERCGGLWLRPAESGWIYCEPCKQKMDEMPTVAGKRRERKAEVAA